MERLAVIMSRNRRPSWGVQPSRSRCRKTVTTLANPAKATATSAVARSALSPVMSSGARMGELVAGAPNIPVEPT